MEQASVEIQQMPVRFPENALEAQVVDRKHRFGARQFGVPFALRVQRNDGQGRLPIVRMHDVDGTLAQDLQSGSPEKDEPLGIVGIIARGRSVEKRPVIIPVGANESDGCPLTERRFQHIGRHLAIGNRGGNVNVGLP